LLQVRAKQLWQDISFRPPSLAERYGLTARTEIAALHFAGHNPHTFAFRVVSGCLALPASALSASVDIRRFLEMARRSKNAGETERDAFLDDIGDRIRQARVKAKLTQKELAEKINASASWVYLVEDGQQNAQVNSLRKVAEALGVSIRSLLPDYPGETDDYNTGKEVGETFDTVINDLTRSVGLLHKLNALRSRR